jgi:hypothetical protein
MLFSEYHPGIEKTIKAGNRAQKKAGYRPLLKRTYADRTADDIPPSGFDKISESVTAF